MRFCRWLSVSFLFLIFYLCIVPSAKADDTVRVLLKQEYNSVQFSVVEGDYQLLDSGTGLTVAYPLPGERWVAFREGMILKVQREGDANSISVSGGVLLQAREGTESLFRFGDKRYRGNLHIVETGGILSVINILDVEDYLYGVLSQEMSPSFPFEALKAQAVVSRTFVTYRKGNHLYYDVTAGTRDQVYGGYEAELVPGGDKIRQAVDETRGQKIYYDGVLIEAVFHSNAGGYTADSEKVWGGARPYLKPVLSPYDVYALEYPQQTSSGWPANSYQWVQSFTADELHRQIARWNNTHPSEAISVGTIVSLMTFGEPIPGDNSGLKRVERLDIVGTRGTVSLSGERAQSVFGLKSRLFAVEYSMPISVSNGLAISNIANGASLVSVVSKDGVASRPLDKGLYVKSSTNTRLLTSGSEEFIFHGRGYGHGVGMSQWGAAGMAAAGYNYQEIIEHYYNQGKFDGRLKILQ